MSEIKSPWPGPKGLIPVTSALYTSNGNKIVNTNFFAPSFCANVIHCLFLASSPKKSIKKTGNNASTAFIYTYLIIITCR